MINVFFTNLFIFLDKILFFTTKKDLKFFQKYQNFFIYSVIGISGVSLDYLLFYIFHNYMNYNKYLVNILSITIGISNNFIWNAFINFKIIDKIWQRFIRFYSTGILGLIISQIILFIFVDFFAFNSALVKFLSIFIIVILQYSLNKTITFKKNSLQFNNFN